MKAQPITVEQLDQIDALVNDASPERKNQEIEPLADLWQGGFKITLTSHGGGKTWLKSEFRGDLAFHLAALKLMPSLTAECRRLRAMLLDLSPDVNPDGAPPKKKAKKRKS